LSDAESEALAAGNPWPRQPAGERELRLQAEADLALCFGTPSNEEAVAFLTLGV
jgi:hypothetical protein